MGFLDCLGRGEGGGGGCQVSQFVAGGPGGSLSVETSGGWAGGIFSFHLGSVRTGGGGLQSQPDHHVSRARL